MFNWNKRNLKVFCYSMVCVLSTIAISIPLNSPLIKTSKSGGYTNQELRKLSLPWYNSLTNASWNYQDGKLQNYFCNSEQQAIALYSWNTGDYWNAPLHQGLEPTNQWRVLPNFGNSNALEIRGSDYKYMSSGLQKSVFPKDIVTYHGVEGIEVEFLDQLFPYMERESNGLWNYDNCVGKVITSNGFISTTLDKEYALNYMNPNEEGPLKTQSLFKIHINKGYRGAAFLANFKFANFPGISYENQILIDLNCKFRINSIEYSNDKIGGYSYNSRFITFDVTLI